MALITLAGRPRSEGQATGTAPRAPNPNTPDAQWEYPFGPTTANVYAMCARRHMHEYGTTSEQLAWIKVAASHHAQHNPHAMLREVVTSPTCSPRRWSPTRCTGSIAASSATAAARWWSRAPRSRADCAQPVVRVIGAGEAVKGQMGGDIDLTWSAARWSGPAAFAEAGVTPADIKYASIYDSFTITVLIQLEDLGFCEKGQGGRFVADGNLIAGVGRLPFNTDGGGLCNNHPANRGGMTKVIEAVRQLRGQAHPAVQVANCDLALAHGTGGLLGSRHGSATLILERA